MGRNAGLFMFLFQRSFFSIYLPRRNPQPLQMEINPRARACQSGGQARQGALSKGAQISFMFDSKTIHFFLKREPPKKQILDPVFDPQNCAIVLPCFWPLLVVFILSGPKTSASLRPPF